MRVLVTGMSGTGKSSALAELARLGHTVVDTDYDGWDDPWDEERMAALLAEHDDLFVSGTVENQGRFYDRFDAVVLLAAPVHVLLARLAARTTNPYGKTERERAEVRRYVETVEPLLRATCTLELDATRPLPEIVAELERVARA
ncbi:MAG TPA: AAA family ATPase [Gaiellaceae bacterium]